MSPTSALLGALFTSLWQVAALAAAFSVVRLSTKSPQLRYLGALVTLAAQLAWPAWTCAQLLQVKLSLASPPTLETSGRWHWVPVLWAVGAGAMVLRTVGGLAVVRRWVATSQAPTVEIESQLEALRQRLKVRPVRWAISQGLTVPLTVGCFRPVVLFPASLLTAVPAGDLELLAAHELIHVRRWDYLVNLGQALVEAVLFFHPAMWWVSGCAREEREYCCDDAVVAGLGTARSYARALLSLEQTLTPVAVAVPSTGGPFMKRIGRILNLGPTSSSLLASIPLLGAFALILLLGSCAARNLSGPQPVAQAPAELVPALRTLCADIRTEASRPEVAQVDRLDLLTVVLASLSERSPKLEAFMAEVSKAPVPHRRDVFRRSVSSAIGSDWSCPDFDALWDGAPLWPSDR